MNMAKMDLWTRLVQEAADGTPMLLIDADTVILNPLDDLWTQPFDLAYTTKPRGSKFPFNAGVIFLRASDAVRSFMQAWCDENRRMFDDESYHRRFLNRYGGLNQAALGALIERGALQTLQVLELPCATWNCEDASWATFTPSTTRILHLKSELRHAALGHRLRIPGDLRPAAAAWRAVATECRTAMRRPA